MKNKRQIAMTVIGLLCIFGFRFLPPVLGLSELGMQILGIFIGTIILWLFVSVTWPSVVCIFALMLTPLFTYESVLQGSMGSWVTSFVMFSSMVTYCLGQTGFLRRCAVWFITRPIAKKNQWLFLGLFFLAPLVIGSFMSPVPTFIVFVPIAEQIFKELGYQPEERFPQMIMLSLLCFSSLSTITTPIAHTVPILGMSLYQEDTGTAIDFVKYTVFGIISAAVIFILIMLMLKYIFKPDTSKLRNLDTEVLLKDAEPMSREEKYTLAVFAGVVFLWMIPGIISPVLPGVSAFISGLGTPTPAIIGVILLCMMRVNGKHLMEFGKAMKEGVPWGAVIMVAGTMVLGSALTNEEAGITDAVVSAISPLIGNLSPMIFVLIVSLWTVIQTNFASNTVTVTLVYSVALPLVYSGAIGGVDPAALTCIIGAGAAIAMATPPSTAHAAIAVGTGWLKTDIMFKYGMIMSVIAAVVLAFVGYPIAAWLM